MPKAYKNLQRASLPFPPKESNREPEEVAAVLFCFACSCSGSSGGGDAGSGGGGTVGGGGDRGTKKDILPQNVWQKGWFGGSALGQIKNF